VRNAGAATCSCRPPLGEFRAASALPLSWPWANLTALQYVDRAGIILRVGPVWRSLKSFEEDCYTVSASKGGEDAGEYGEGDESPRHRLGRQFQHPSAPFWRLMGWPTALCGGGSARHWQRLNVERAGVNVVDGLLKFWRPVKPFVVGLLVEKPFVEAALNFYAALNRCGELNWRWAIRAQQSQALVHVLRQSDFYRPALASLAREIDHAAMPILARNSGGGVTP
jgi:hypothetical protein